VVKNGRIKVPGKKVSLNIKNPEVYELAARLAELQGTTITAAVLHALRSELARCRPRRGRADEISRMEVYSRRISSMPLLDTRSEDEILGYGPGGYPGGD
jgi:antitoxin VapB